MRFSLPLSLLMAAVLCGCDQEQQGSPVHQVTVTRTVTQASTQPLPQAVAKASRPSPAPDTAPANETPTLLPLTAAHDPCAVQNPVRLLRFAEEFGMLLREIRSMRSAIAEQRKTQKKAGAQ